MQFGVSISRMRDAKSLKLSIELGQNVPKAH